MKIILQALRLFAVITLLTGIAYPLAMTELVGVLFPKQAQGSLIEVNGKVIGSDLLAQKFEAPKYFWPRPSVADYATVASGASNKGPTSADLRKAIDQRREKFGADAPEDLLTASGSGLDPHLSPEAARFQVARVAAARGLPNERLHELIDRETEAPQWGLFGEPRVNVLRLNRALDQE